MADQSSDHKLIRKLLSAPNHAQIPGKSPLKMDYKSSVENECDIEEKLHSYLSQCSGQPEVINVVEMDHSYSLPWNWRPDHCFAKPAKKLFWTTKRTRNNVTWGEETIDPATEEKELMPPYDVTKAELMLDETVRIIPHLRPETVEPDWEENLPRGGDQWSHYQRIFFHRILKILMLDQLARLSQKGKRNEPLLRRIVINKSARRFRSIMGSVHWTTKHIQWLHNELLSRIDDEYLVSYIDIIQTLHRKTPDLVERLISGPVSSKINPDALNLLLKRPWDPTSPGLTYTKPRRLPGNPLIVIVPYGAKGGAETNKRVQRWLPHLSAIGVVIPVYTNTSNKITVLTSLEHMMSATRAKLGELRSEYGHGRKIILFGLNSGAALACQVALLETISVVVCLGFPVNTVEGKRGYADDNMLNLNTPVIFVVGQHSSTSYIDDIEEIREKMRVETGLVLVGGADNQLRISKTKQRADGISQTMVDRCIIDEVSDFIGNVLTSPPKSLSQYQDYRARFRVAEKKMRIAIQDDAIPMKQYVFANSRRGMRGGRGRGRYNTLGRNGGVPVSRRGGMVEKAVTRPSIENISIINSSNLEHITLTGESATIKILPQIKVLGGSDSADSLIDQLTPDKLLELPVIMAPDNQQPTQIKVVGGRGRPRKNAGVRSSTVGRPPTKSRMHVPVSHYAQQ